MTIRKFCYFSKHFYLGSANVGTRGTTLTKELGMFVKNCPILGQDARKLFDVYWAVDGLKELPKIYPRNLWSTINVNHPLRVLNSLDGVIYDVRNIHL